MQRLSGLDAAFLALETPSSHMHVMGVSVVDPSTSNRSWGHETVRDLLEARIPFIPPFRRRLVQVPLQLGPPSWIDDPDFDIDYHLRRAALPQPGGPEELAAFVADVAGRPLDRARPLWEAWVVEGLEHGHYAFIAKIHHALIDGVSGVEILASLFDVDPNAPIKPDEISDAIHVESVPSDLELLARGALTMATRPLYFAKAFRRFSRGLYGAVMRVRENSLDVALPLQSPRLSINRRITPHRKVAFSSVPLDDIKAVKNTLGVTVNDVVLAVTAGAMRTYLERRGELPDRSLVAAVPTSVRTEDQRGTHGNRVSAMFAGLPVEIEDPVERVRAVGRSTKGAKEVHEEVGGETLQDWAEVAAPALFSRAMRLYSRLQLGERVRPVINLVVSNVPGPSFPLYLAGAQLVALHPLGPIFDDSGLNLTVLSYLDHVDFGFIACRELVPDLDEMAAAIPDALQELMKAANATL